MDNNQLQFQFHNLQARYPGLSSQQLQAMMRAQFPQAPPMPGLPYPGLPMPPGYYPPGMPGMPGLQGLATQLLHLPNIPGVANMAGPGRQPQQQRQRQRVDAAPEEGDHRGEGEGQEEDANVYIQYQPMKVKEGVPHPDPIVETSSLSGISPPDVTYQHHIQDIVNSGQISNAQLETVVYANMRFRQRLPTGARAGFFLGDGAGVGKGRQIAALILDFYRAGGKRVLWVSTSNDLRYDARRDLEDVGATDVPVYPPKKDPVPKGDLGKVYPEGVLFVTYSLLVQKGKAPVTKKGRGSGNSSRGSGLQRKGSSSNGLANMGSVDADADPLARKSRKEQIDELFHENSRLTQIQRWLAGSKDGHCLIILDECHKAKNLVDNNQESTQTGLAVEAIQDRLPNACVLYSSATGASEANNLRYMVRLGTGGFDNMGDLIRSLTKSGLGALELFCMGLKATGTYLSRTLSYQGAEFRLDKVDIDPIFTVMYERSTILWQLLLRIMKQLPKAGKRDMKGALFWSAHQRFYRQMLIAAKVKTCADLAAQALAEGMCVVIGLQSTGEANTNEAKQRWNDGESEDFVSAPRMILQTFVRDWLFHFKEMPNISSRQIKQLELQVSRTIKRWREMPSCAEQAVKNLKKAAQLEAAAKRREEEKEAQRAARALLDAQRVQAGDDASADAGQAAAAAEDDEVVVCEERGLEQVLEARRLQNILTGNMIDLTVDMSEEELNKGMAEIAQEEAEAAERAEQERWAAREAELTAQLEEAVAALSKAQADLAAAQSAAQAADGKQPAASGAASNAGKRKAAAVASELEDSVGPGAQPAAKRPARRRAAIIADDDDDDDKENELEDTLAPQPVTVSLANAASVAAAAGAVVTGAGAPDLSVPRTGQVLASEELKNSRDAVAGRRRMQPVDDEVTSPPKAAKAPAGRPPRHPNPAPPPNPSTCGRAAASTGGRAGRSASGSRSASEVSAEVPLTSGKAGRGKKRVLDESEDDQVQEDVREGKEAEAEAGDDAEADDDDDILCRVCGSGTDGERMILCDICDAPYHIYCLKPKLRCVPKGDWFCPDCDGGSTVSKSKGGAAASGSKKPCTSAAPATKQKKARKPADDDDDDDNETDDLEDDEDDEEFVAPKPSISASRQRSAPMRQAAAAAIRRNRPADWTDEDDDGDDDFQRPAANNARAANMQLLAAKRKLTSAQERVDAAQAALNRHLHGGGRPAASGKNRSGSRASSMVESEGDELPLGRRMTRGAAAAGYKHAVQHRALASKKKQRQSADSNDDDGDSSDDDDLSDDSDGDSSYDGSSMDDEDLVPEDDDGNDRGVGHPGLVRCRNMLLRLIEAQELPANPLDQLTELLGGEDCVAEMTGRRGLLTKNAQGKVIYKIRCEEEAQKMVNMREKQSFMDGDKLVAIISEAASTGISLQADRRAKNTRRRCHITLELPWSADKAIQQFGRSHRSNQASAPVYHFLVSKCGGEFRFAGAVAKRLQSLGALLQGDRKAIGAAGDLKSYDVDNKYGELALSRVYDSILGRQQPMLDAKIPQLPFSKVSAQAQLAGAGNYDANLEFFKYMEDRLYSIGLFQEEIATIISDAHSTDVPRFLNRLLGLALDDQEMLFDYFSSTLDLTIKQAKSAGTYDDGMLTITRQKCKVVTQVEIDKDRASGAPMHYMEIQVDDGCSWEQALEERDKALADMQSRNLEATRMIKVGFYAFKRSNNYGGTGHPLVLMATEVMRSSEREKMGHFRVLRPNQVGGWLFKDWELHEKYKKISDEEAKRHWQFWHVHLSDGCLHGKDCVRRRKDGHCNFGSRFWQMHLITGAVLPHMRTLFDTVMTSAYGRNSEGKKTMPRGARCVLEDGRTVVGLNLLKNDVDMFVSRVQT